METKKQRLNELIKIKHNYLNKLKNIENEIEEITKNIVDECEHEWIREREPGPYGELLTICSKCRKYRYCN
jgi:phage host-nuclease inhibitor protein Gam